MRTSGVFFLSLILLAAFFCVANAQDRGGGSSLDQGGTYCGGAVTIPSTATDYIDTGFLDGDNDCSTPLAWPYNDIFYRFTPNADGLYIFRLQLGLPSTDVALRIMANFCCSGGTPAAAINTPMVAADCDTGRTVYLRDTLMAGVDYYFHLGDNSTASHHSPYRFEMMRIECPRTDANDPLHQTCLTALEIAQNGALVDSIMGDSATEANPDWYKFTLTTNSIVTISELGRTFGHCTTGYYPLCFDNPINAHFWVYCTCPGPGVPESSVLIYEAHGELCSTDAQAVLCLPGGGQTYYIKVANYQGISWAGWDYILKYEAQPTTQQCAALPPGCGGPQPCTGNPTASVTFQPIYPFPHSQTQSHCAQLSTDDVTPTMIFVGVFNSSNLPTVTITSGCDGCSEPTVCSGLPAEFWAFNDNPGSWVFLPNHPIGPFPSAYVNNTLTLSPQALGCCVCVHLDYVQPVELTSFTAAPGDRQVTLNWATASETNNDHFEIARNGTSVAVVQGAGTTAQAHSYHWTDNGLSNYQDYSYTLTAVDLGGTRHTVGTVSARPSVEVSAVSDYALRQNYPNPFNPTTQISFDLVETGMTSLKVYNLMGQEVATLVNGSLAAGRHEVSFDAAKLPSGIYIYTLKVNGFTADKKMLLMK